MCTNFRHMFLLLVLLFATLDARSSGIQSQLDNIFDDMSNYTSPGSFETQRTGGYFGGRYTSKSKIFQQELISFKAPSAKGGCGGIDVFGGSFSFVNSDQIVQLLRSVASNAKGYAFQLAMDNMCPDCMKWMNELQSKMQDLTSNLSNSCQLAQGIVNSTFPAWAEKHGTEHTISSIKEGIGTDYAELKKHIGTLGTSAQELHNNAPDKYYETAGAVMYVAMKESGYESWLTDGDEEFVEVVLSLTGSVVIGAPVPKADGEPGPAVTRLPGNKITLKEIIEGTQAADKYDCDKSTVADKCIITGSDVDPIEIEPLYTKIAEAFVGDSGLISRIYARDYSGEPLEWQKRIMAAQPDSLGSKIYTLAPISPAAAEDMVRKYSKAIALELTYNLIRESFISARLALKSFPDNYKAENDEVLKEAETLLRSEYRDLAREYGDINTINEHYNTILDKMRTPTYFPTSFKGSK